MAWCLVKHAEETASGTYWIGAGGGGGWAPEPFRMLWRREKSFSCLIHAYLLTPWCWILFEKLIVTQLVKKCPAFLWNPKVHYRVHTSPQLDPILSQLNPVRPINPYLLKDYLNVILPPTPRSSQWSLAFGPPNQNPLNTPPPCVPHVPPISSSWM
jgi:hypothetical protein